MVIFELDALLLELLETFLDFVTKSFKLIEPDEFPLVNMLEPHLELPLLPLKVLLAIYSANAFFSIHLR